MRGGDPVQRQYGREPGDEADRRAGGRDRVCTLDRRRHVPSRPLGNRAEYGAAGRPARHDDARGDGREHPRAHARRRVAGRAAYATGGMDARQQGRRQADSRGRAGRFAGRRQDRHRRLRNDERRGRRVVAVARADRADRVLHAGTRRCEGEGERDRRGGADRGRDIRVTGGGRRSRQALPQS
ncbi:hypothetical protein BVI1335_900011 [Burkholderia vietnamiensis]|nr:hypothetical protein BVI1335_900011 [Burkholderia vietnamiensis]